MLFKYFYDDALAHASYLVGCQRAREAIVIDPSREIEHYVEAAAEEGMKITGVAETHIHADFVSGAKEMAARIGAKLYLSDEGPHQWKYAYAQDFNHRLLKEGDTFLVGKIEFKVMHTPGHTPESISFLLTDKGGGADKPMGIFTGDFVFVGSIGRPDLLEEAAGIMGTAETGARELFQSIQRFKELPDHLQVWPAHGAGSACGKGLGSIPSSTVGYEKLFNPALQFTAEQSFVDYILSDQPEVPKYFSIMKRVNKEGPALLGAPKSPPKLEIDKLRETVAMEMVVDTASAKTFATAHVEGTISIQLKYLATWAGSLLDYDQSVYLISSDQDLSEAIRILHKIGIDNIGGYFSSSEVSKGGLNTASIVQMSPQEVSKKIEAGEVQLVDVRSLEERVEIAPAGSQHLFLGELPRKLEQFEADKAYAFCCRSGGRSVIACSIALQIGECTIVNMDGGVAAWQSANLPMAEQPSQLQST